MHTPFGGLHVDGTDSLAALFVGGARAHVFSGGDDGAAGRCRGGATRCQRLRPQGRAFETRARCSRYPRSSAPSKESSAGEGGRSTTWCLLAARAGFAGRRRRTNAFARIRRSGWSTLTRFISPTIGAIKYGAGNSSSERSITTCARSTTTKNAGATQGATGIANQATSSLDEGWLKTSMRIELVDAPIRQVAEAHTYRGLDRVVPHYTE
mmetsp:Transcript_116867/g.330648  ORF Transcript_116867/g.330648 Transcript_116867/m.330648 type:complete len:210 (-) Transcript_116867:188-817(-)